MQKKEYYKHNLPHFQQPGQAYFITWSLKDAVPKHALNYFTNKLEILRTQMNTGLVSHLGLADSNPPFYNHGTESATPKPRESDLGLANSNSPLNKSRIGVRDTREEKLILEYKQLLKRYIKTYNELLDAQQNPKINLSKPENTRVLIDAFNFWESKKLKNHAFCIMPNHVHWVMELFEKDEKGKTVYLQDILYSVKRFSATKINKLENRSGSLWQKESFDTTIRDRKHLYYTVEYTLNNPVNAGFVNDWRDWKGCWCSD